LAKGRGDPNLTGRGKTVAIEPWHVRRPRGTEERKKERKKATPCLGGLGKNPGANRERGTGPGAEKGKVEGSSIKLVFKMRGMGSQLKNRKKTLKNAREREESTDRKTNFRKWKKWGGVVHELKKIDLRRCAPCRGVNQAGQPI